MSHALLLGDGDGRFLESFCARYPQARIDYVDVSQKMLDLARRRAGGEKVTYYHDDARTFALPNNRYDLIAAHFFFDCFEEHELENLIKAMSASTNTWLVSEFRQTRWSALLLRTLYLFFRITTGLRTKRLTDHRPLLERAGFRLECEERGLKGLVVSELWIKSNRNNAV